MATKTLIAALACAASVSAHGYIEKIVADGQSHVGYNPSNAPWQEDQGSVAWTYWATDLGFVSANELQSNDISCHLGATSAKKSAAVTAGSDIELKWNTWPQSHHGPVINYLADCGGDCANADKNSLKWFKIQEKGQIELGSGGGSPGFWADDELFENNLSMSVKIPSDIKPGNYVLRHEIIALHEGLEQGGAQFYPQCINLKISGGGTKSPEGTVATELYQSNDPGVLYNIYNDEKHPTYTIPGPKLYNA